MLLRRRPAASEPGDTKTGLPEQPVDKRDYMWAAGIAIGFYLLALWRLGSPDQQYFDEIYHARSGMEYALGLEAHEWTHPPLAKLLIAASLLLWRGTFNPRDGTWQQDFHYSPHQAFAWRYPSVLFGCFALIALYALARALFRNRTAAIAATLMLACDGVFFVQSRIAMTNTFTVFFVLLSAQGTWQFLRRDGETRSYRWLLLTGLGLGLALATRWSTLWSWGLTGIALLWHLFARLLPHWLKEDKTLYLRLLQWVGGVVLAMFVIPAALYAISYIPFVLQGYGTLQQKLFTANGTGHGWARAIQLQKDMWGYHANIKEKHPYSSPWWSWPLMVRPTWYYFQRDDVTKLVSGVWAIGNAAIWWASLPAFLTAGILGWRERRVELGLIVLFGVGQWVMWGVEPRSLIFMHYYYECIPFACLAIAYLGCRLWYSGDEGKRVFATCYAVLIAAWFVYYYPLLSALPINERYYQLHLWLGRPWI